MTDSENKSANVPDVKTDPQVKPPVEISRGEAGSPANVNVDVNTVDDVITVKIDSDSPLTVDSGVAAQAAADKVEEKINEKKNKPASLHQLEDKISNIQVEKILPSPPGSFAKILNTLPGVNIGLPPATPKEPEKTLTTVPVITDYKDVPSYALIGLDANRQPTLIWTSPLISKNETVLERKSIIYKMVFLIIAPIVILLWLTNVVGMTTYFNVKFDTGFSASLTVLVMSLISSFTGSAIGQAKVNQESNPKTTNKYIQYYFIDFSGDDPKIASKSAKFMLTPTPSEKSLVSQIALGILSLTLTFFWIIGGTNAFSFWTGQDLTSDKAEFSTLTNVFLFIISLVAGLASFSAVDSSKK